MITDILFEAELEIERYLIDMPDGYDVPGEPCPEQVERLLQQMRAVRINSGFDSSPLTGEPL